VLNSGLAIWGTVPTRPREVVSVHERDRGIAVAASGAREKPTAFQIIGSIKPRSCAKSERKLKLKEEIAELRRRMLELIRLTDGGLKHITIDILELTHLLDFTDAAVASLERYGDPKGIVARTIPNGGNDARAVLLKLEQEVGLTGEDKGGNQEAS
jgi:hypothetical protein